MGYASQLAITWPAQPCSMSGFLSISQSIQNKREHCQHIETTAGQTRGTIESDHQITH